MTATFTEECDPALLALFRNMAERTEVAEGAVQAYLQLEPRLREEWISQLERAIRQPGPPLGAVALALFTAETSSHEPGAQRASARGRRLWSCAQERPFSLVRDEGAGARTWRLLRPMRCEWSSVASVRLSEQGRVERAELWPLSRQGWELGFEGIALSDAISALAHAVVREPARLRPVLAPFAELFSASFSAHEDPQREAS